MGHRLSKITTRTGDKGMTGLATGARAGKDSPRVFAMGAVDELNSCIGVVLAHGVLPQVRECLVDVQHRLFEAGAQLSSPGQRRIAEEDVLVIERSGEPNLMSLHSIPLTRSSMTVCFHSSTGCRISCSS